MISPHIVDAIKGEEGHFSWARVVKIQFLMIALTICFCLTPNANAETVQATSCSQGNVQSAINAASTGDTVVVPTGICEWNTSVSIPNSKKITLQGAGMNSTVIRRNPAGTALTLGQSGSRITALGLVNGVISADGYDFRIDHCKMTFDSWTDGITVMSRNANPAVISTGIIDNCDLTNMRILVSGTNLMLQEGSAQHTLWDDSLDLGTNKAVYVEDNTFTNGTNAIDGSYGGRYVFRYNTLTNVSIEAHSVQGNNRAIRKWEIYGNTMIQTSGYKYLWVRGGTGVIFDNKAAGAVDFRLDNVRSYRNEAPGGLCDGDSPWDGNQDVTGWPCRDQIGRSTDEWRWTNEKPYPRQTSAPAYFWNNYIGNSVWSAQVVNNSDGHIKPNRDYYDFIQREFDGRIGTGRGALVNRPAACTEGVAYWATDVGDWNQRGPSGALYKCTAPNTWSLYYRPYAYPHPLRELPSPLPSLQRPQNLKVIR